MFAIIEIILFLWLIYQVTQNLLLLFLLFVGIFLIVKSRKGVPKQKNNQTRIGLFLILFSILSTQAVWAMALIAILFLLFAFYDKSDSPWLIFGKTPLWKQKEFVSLQTIPSEGNFFSERKMTWIGKEVLGRSAYEWEDINFTKLMGETVIDLGNTILPNQINTVVIRNGFGRIRLLVPSDVGVTVNYSTLHGTFLTENKKTKLKNQQIIWSEDGYEEKPRKLSVTVNILVGDLEVISL